MQPEFVASIIEGCHEHGLHVAVDTSGAVHLLACRKAVEEADLLCWTSRRRRRSFSGKLPAGEWIIRWRSSERERLGKPVWIRHVLVPGLTLDDVQLHQLGRLPGITDALKRWSSFLFTKWGV